MADNLLELAVRQLGPSGISALTAALGIPADKGESALDTGLASVIAGMLNKGSSKTGMASLFNMITDSGDLDFSSIDKTFADPEQMDSLQRSGANMIDGIFGSKAGSVSEKVAAAIGVDTGVGGSLLSVATPVLVALLGRLVKSKGMDVSQLAAFLFAQRPHLKGRLPAGLLKTLGVHEFGDLGARLETHGHAEPQEPRPESLHHTPAKKPGSFGKWFWPLLIALAALYALNMCAKKQEMEDKPGGVILDEEGVIIEERPDGTAVPPDTTAPGTTTPGTTTPGTAAPGATAPDTAAGADFGSSFREYLTNPARDPNRDFPLQVAFAADSAEVTGSATPDVDALAKILQENPGVTIAVEGHTSGGGDEMAEQELSQRRADAVRQLLLDKGIEANRITATGMGSAKPVTTGGSPAGQQPNERVSVRVVTFE